MSDPTIKPSWILVRRDETRDFSPKFLAAHKVNRVWLYYVAEETRHVHLCELTPSLELTYVGFDYETVDGSEPDDANAADEEREARFDALTEAIAGVADEPIYLHVSDVERARAAGNVRESCGPDIESLDDITGTSYDGLDDPLYEAQLDDLREHYAGNAPGW